MDMAQKIADNAPVAVKYAKSCITQGMNMSLDRGIVMENEYFAMCYATKDQKEGMTAFLEKRDPCFTGK
jgi:enoyl-CoA hydratase